MVKQVRGRHTTVIGTHDGEYNCWWVYNDLYLADLYWLLRSSAGKKRIIMLFYSHLIIIWEQHAEKIPWLVTKAH
jgi:hypothetical protein